MLRTPFASLGEKSRSWWPVMRRFTLGAALRSSAWLPLPSVQVWVCADTGEVRVALKSTAAAVETAARESSFMGVTPPVNGVDSTAIAVPAVPDNDRSQ